ncbi:MAG: GntR family transcriptional regulator [Balneolaceae bacterium]|nr:MAG: GntR family transcriptional regulator [Balneolaceae bacterium]
MNHPIPKYYQIYEELLNDITQGKYKENDLFPSDTELVKRFNYSRGTIREAIKLLFQQGYLVRKQGKGTYVTYKKIKQDADRLIGFTELMLQHDLEPSANVLKKEFVVPNANISYLMELEPGEKVVRLIRLRYGNRMPLIIERSFFNAALFEPIFSMDLETNSIYSLLYKHTGTRLGKADQQIEAISASYEENKWLEVDPGTPLLLIKRLIKTTEGTIFQYSEDVYRSDRITFSTQTLPYQTENESPDFTPD